jgi:hypothetical protein
MFRTGANLAPPEEIHANSLVGALTMIPAEHAGLTNLLAKMNFPQFVTAWSRECSRRS